MNYLIAALILTIIHYRNLRTDKREEMNYQISIQEIYEYGQRKQQDRFVFHELECVNEYAHQKNYQRDILNYKDYTGQGNQGLAKKVYQRTYNQVRKSNGEKATPDQAYTALEVQFASYDEIKFEFEMCKLMANQGYCKDAILRWNNAKKGKKATVITQDDTKNSISWDFKDLTSKHLQTLSA